MRKAEVLLAGLGGQGVQLAGDILARACTLAGMHVSVLPSYGAEARGTLIRTEIVIADEEIIYPGVLEPDIFAAFSQDAYDRFSPLLMPETAIFYDSASVTPREVPHGGSRQYAIPAMEAAAELGDAKAANMIMLGALASASDLIPQDALKRVLCEGPSKRAEASIRALQKGAELAAQSLGH